MGNANALAIHDSVYIYYSGQAPDRNGLYILDLPRDIVIVATWLEKTRARRIWFPGRFKDSSKQVLRLVTIVSAELSNESYLGVALITAKDRAYYAGKKSPPEWRGPIGFTGLKISRLRKDLRRKYGEYHAVSKGCLLPYTEMPFY